MSIRFGLFEFHPATGELCREGARVPLQAQPAQVLGLLIQHAGQIVSRAQLKEAIWGSDTFVDFDKGLNFCIAQVRSALGDSADAPLYIRTVPKQGYQFIAPANLSDQGLADIGQARVSPPPVSAFTRLSLTGLAIIMIISAMAFWMLHARHDLHQEFAAAPTVRVAVARFDNETGDAQFDRLADALSDSVTAKLTTSGAGRYGVIGNATILRTPRSQRDLIAIGSSLNAQYVVLAQVRKDSIDFFVLAHLIHLPDQTHIAVTEMTCAADASLQNQSDIARHIADKFSPLIAHLDSALPPHKAM